VRIVDKSSEEKEKLKKAIFEAMSPRRRKFIEKIGFDKWDPFQEPKDPIDIRRDQTKRTTKELVREFLVTKAHEEYSNAYGRGVLEMALGIVNNEDRFMGMYEFASWYRDLLEKERHGTDG
jgi:hypothetical protein